MSDDQRKSEIPAEELAALEAMVNLSDDTLWVAAREQMPADMQARMSVLMTKNNFGTITDEEYAELAAYVEEGDKLVLKKHNGKQMDSNLEPRRRGAGYLLSGLVFCGHIDGEEHPMNIESTPAKKGKRGKYTFFICATMKNSRGTSCEAERISMKSLDQTVIENLLAHVLTMANLRPLAKNIAESLIERSSDAGTRIMALEDQLAEVQKSLENIMDAIEQMGYAKRLQQRFDERKREEEELLTEIATLQALQVNPTEIAQISDEALEGWINYMRDALTDEEDRAVARRIIERFVAKIVIKEGTGTLYYTFPFPDEVYMPSVRDLDLRRLELLTSTVRL